MDILSFEKAYDNKYGRLKTHAKAFDCLDCKKLLDKRVP